MAVMASLVRRPIRTLGRGGNQGQSAWYDVLALDSEYDYDPVWAKCVELKVSPTFTAPRASWKLSPVAFEFHTTTSAISATRRRNRYARRSSLAASRAASRRSSSLSSKAASAGAPAALCRSLIGHWKKRNAAALAESHPANLDRKQLGEIAQRIRRPRMGRAARQYRSCPKTQQPRNRVGGTGAGDRQTRLPLASRRRATSATYSRAISSAARRTTPPMRGASTPRLTRTAPS